MSRDSSNLFSRSILLTLRSQESRALVHHTSIVFKLVNNMCVAFIIDLLDGRLNALMITDCLDVIECM